MYESHTYGRYLSAKVTVDDRALNQYVVSALRTRLEQVSRPPQLLEIGAGLGTMIARLVNWGLITRADYHLVDIDRQSLHDAHRWLSSWAASRDLTLEQVEPDKLRISSICSDININVQMACAELFAFIGQSAQRPNFDLLIANAVLDLIDVPTVLPRLIGLVMPGGSCWFSVNFDGETIFQPEHPLDDALLEIYHRSMDQRVRYGRPAGDSRTGRHLFGHLPAAGANIVASGSSDWVVHAINRKYAGDEAYFIEHILFTIETELKCHKEVDPHQLRDWLRTRRIQLERGELVYIAHQLDFLASVR